jgi:beta-phosphoglucomutase-like phosphatase (HAD superfamily)
MLQLAGIEVDRVRALLLDADGCLFPSEGPAFDASVGTTNRFLARLGSERELTADQLRRTATGRNFRETARGLAADRRITISPAELEAWAVEERELVTAHLRDVLRPDAEVREPLLRLAARFRLAVVSSSAQARVDACLEATGLSGLLPEDVRFSAEDSLRTPTSKPDPAIYEFAGSRLGVRGLEGLAVEDSAPGVESAVAAGFPVVGNLVFVPEAERAERFDELARAGTAAIIESWAELEALLERAPEPLGQPRAVAHR